MTLTSSEIDLIRLLSGDVCEDETAECVTDAQIQTFYDDTGTECGTVVNVIRVRLAKATTKTGVDRTTGGAIGNPSVQSILDLLEYWQPICPEVWPEIGQGTIDLGIDEEVATT